MGGSRRIGSIMKLSFLCLTLLNGAYGGDTITSAKPLSGNQTIVSSGSNFELGFYRPGNSSSYYVSIWYKQIPFTTPVWVANRDNPISDLSSAQLQISNGNLVITNGSNSAVWSTDLSIPTSASVHAVLKDDGNLVLVEEPDSTHFLWQSFDYPTHTWLPGAKLARNKKTKRNQNLIAWKNTQDPATGLFSLELDPNGTSQYFILWNNTNLYWSSGEWDDQHKIFSLVPEMKLNYAYNFSYVDNENESYFTYSVYDKSLISRFFIDVSGQIKQQTWFNNSQQWNQFWEKPAQQCDVYAFCGAFGACNNQNSLQSCNCLQGFNPKSNQDWNLNDYTEGCVRNTQLNCGKDASRKDNKDKFWTYPNMKLPQNPESVNASTIEECDSYCLRSCSCNAYAYDSQGCFVWIGSLLNMTQLSDGDPNGFTLYLRLSASEFSSKSNKKLIVGAVAGSIAGLLVLFLVGSFLIYYGKKRRSARTKKIMEGSLVAFSYRDLQNATKNFSEKLGGGGFGSVFKGTLLDSSFVAVKKLDSINQGEKQFRTEVSTIGTIQHVNLVRLRGFCSEGTRKLLVYDYMPNGSLDAHLFHGHDKLLDWKTRYEVALGTARGLAYLHEKCRDCIIHCDIKPENILLDADFCPKVADFGLAKLVGREFSRVLTTMRGTRGYLAPEWISGVAVTAKADVYSYGMMIFELVWGRRNTEQSEDGKIRFFPAWAASIMTEGGDILSIVDPKLESNVDIEQVMKICKLGCWCIQEDEGRRPSMGQVVQILEGVLDVSMPPIPRSLQLFANDHENVVFFTDSSTSQSSQTKSSASTSPFHTNKNCSPINNKFAN